MRALAAALRSTAANVASVDQAVWGSVSNLHFSGPAATRIAGMIRGWHGDVSGAAQQLNDAAGTLERSASDVEAQQMARARLLHQLQEQERQDRGQK
jgi:hypothetical protein